MFSFPFAEMMIAGPKVGIVDHEIGLSPFFSQSELFSHILVVV